MKIELPQFPVEGGCVCGALSYRVSGSPHYIIACHCLTCQCLSGSDYVLAMLLPRDHFTLVTGKVQKCHRTAESGRVLPGYFCAECGTRVWHEPTWTKKTINLRAGTLDDPYWASPIAHMWVSRKKPHVILPEGLYFDAQPLSSDRNRLIAAWQACVAQ